MPSSTHRASPAPGSLENHPPGCPKPARLSSPNRAGQLRAGAGRGFPGLCGAWHPLTASFQTAATDLRGLSPSHFSVNFRVSSLKRHIPQRQFVAHLSVLRKVGLVCAGHHTCAFWKRMASLVCSWVPLSRCVSRVRSVRAPGRKLGLREASNVCVAKNDEMFENEKAQCFLVCV